MEAPTRSWLDRSGLYYEGVVDDLGKTLNFHWWKVGTRTSSRLFTKEFNSDTYIEESDCNEVKKEVSLLAARHIIFSNKRFCTGYFCRLCRQVTDHKLNP